MNGASRDEPTGVHAAEALPLLIEWAAGRKNTLLARLSTIPMRNIAERVQPWAE